MKVVINWVGPWQDKGEAAMLISTVKIIREYIEKPQIVAILPYNSLQRIDIEKYGGYDIEVYQDMFSNLFPIVKKISIFRSKIMKFFLTTPFFVFFVCKYSLWLTLNRLFGINYHILVKDCEDEIKSYIESDWIIMCGGQNLVEDFGFESLIILYILNFSKALRKPVMIWANSFGVPQNHLITFLIRNTLSRIDIITTREEISKKLLDSINVTCPVVTTADSAFYLDSVSKNEALKLIENESKICNTISFVGISVIPWHFNIEPDGNDPKAQNYINVMAKVSDYLIDTYKVHLLFFPQVIHSAKDDRKASLRVFNQIKNKSQVTVLTNDYSPEQLKGMYGCIDLLIATRFHSCILAQSMHVPTIAIEYDGQKAKGIMEMLEVNDFVCDINNITYEEVIQKIDKIWLEKKIIQEKLKRNIKIMQLKCKENMKLAILYLKLEKKDLKMDYLSP